MGEFEHEDIITNLYAQNQPKNSILMSVTCQSDPLRQNLNGSRSKFDIKKF